MKKALTALAGTALAGVAVFCTGFRFGAARARAIEIARADAAADERNAEIIACYATMDLMATTMLGLDGDVEADELVDLYLLARHPGAAGRILVPLNREMEEHFIRIEVTGPDTDAVDEEG